MYSLSDESRRRLREACQRIADASDAEWWHGRFEPYFRMMASDKGFNKNVRAMEHDLGLLDVNISGKRALDAGCGSSIYGVVLALEGAAEVDGLDVWEEEICFARGYLRDILGGTLPVSIHNRNVGDTGFPDAHFDLVFCREAISHFHDPYGFLQEAARVLKPGGKLFISDGNNASNPRIRNRTFEIWHRFENGPVGTFLGHDIDEAIVDQRRGILKRNIAGLSEYELDALAKSTFGMNEEQIIEAGQHYKSTGAMPSSDYARGKCPVDPHTGMLLENLFEPYTLAGEIRKMGFDTRVYAYFSHGRHPALAAISRVLEKVSRVSIHMAPTFQIVATRVKS